MRTVQFYSGTNRSGNLLHIETDGAVVNIRVGLHDSDGRKVTSIEVLPDDEHRGGDGEGRVWHTAYGPSGIDYGPGGVRIIRQPEGET